MNALVLAGGNLKGAYQVGALKKIAEKGLKIDHIYGCSVGAVNAFAWLYGDATVMEKMWLSIQERSQIIKRESLWKCIFKYGFLQYNMNPLKEMMRRYSENRMAREDLKVTVAFVDLLDGSLVHYTSDGNNKEELMHWVIASASEPPLVAPLDDRYFDGGVRDQTPLKQAIDDGYENIYVVLNNPWPGTMDPWSPKWPLALNGLTRTVDMLANEVFMNDIQRCLALNGHPDYKHINIKYIFPKKPLVGGFNVEPEVIKEGIQMGYQDAEEFFK